MKFVVKHFVLLNGVIITSKKEVHCSNLSKRIELFRVWLQRCTTAMVSSMMTSSFKSGSALNIMVVCTVCPFSSLLLGQGGKAVQ